MNAMMRKIREKPEDAGLYREMERALQLLISLSADLDLWEVQNGYFTIGKEFFAPMKEKAEAGEESAKAWMEAFQALGSPLRVKVP
jgi:hypothetical protein